MTETPEGNEPKRETQPVKISNSPIKPKKAPEGYKWVVHHRKEGTNKPFAYRLEPIQKVQQKPQPEDKKTEDEKFVEQLRKEYVPLHSHVTAAKYEDLDD